MTRASGPATLRRLLENARYEVLPTGTAYDKVCAHVPHRTAVTVTASASKGLEETFDLALRLTAEGYVAVPHLAARMIHSRAELEEIVHRLVEGGITQVFVPGGDPDPVGDYPDALTVLEDLTAIGHPFSHVGITGYPESHPTISDDLTVQSMWDKRRHATHIVSNLTFDPDAVDSWVRRLRRRGVTMPLLLGVPGPVDRTKLLTMATRIGVGESTRFLTKHKSTLARLAAPGGFTGERFLEQCAATAGEPDLLVEGLHVFTFNQVAETEAWRQDLLTRVAADAAR